MPYKSLPKLTSSALLDLILIHASITAESTFLTTPHYDRLSQSQAAWREVLKTLEEPAIEGCENTVNQAFAEYEALLNDYFWTLGIISAIEKHLSAGDGSEQQGNTPGSLIAAEGKLKQVCNQFSELMSAENKEKCEDYFMLRKSAVDIVGAYFCRHGMDFVNELLARVGLSNAQNDEEIPGSAI